MAFRRYRGPLSQRKRRVRIVEGFFFQLPMAMMYDTRQTGALMSTASDHQAMVEHLREGRLEDGKGALRAHIIIRRWDDVQNNQRH